MDRPAPKKQPGSLHGRSGPYSRDRASGTYAANSSGSADVTVAADSSGLQPEPPTEAPPQPLLAIAAAVGYCPGFDPEPLIVHMPEGEAGWPANLEFFQGCGDQTMSMLDQVAGEVFFPIPDVVLGDNIIYKAAGPSPDKSLYWYFIASPEDKVGWYLAAMVVNDFADIDEELLLAICSNVR